MNKERLLLQIDVLRQIKPKQFDMDAWVEPCECGSAVCAFGSLALDPRAQAMGLTLTAAFCDEDEDTQSEQTVLTIEKFNELAKAGAYPSKVTPVFDGAEDFDAAAEFFDIPLTTARHLFDPHRYEYSRQITPNDVIHRIERYIEHVAKHTTTP